MTTMKAVQFDRYGDIDVLEVRDIPRPVPADGEVLLRIKAAAINPGEAMIRRGLLHDRWPATFPSGEGSDLAGIVVQTGAGVANFVPGDAVLGFSDMRAAHAEFAVVPAGQLTAKPPGLSWEVAGALFVAGTTAYAAVKAVALSPGDVVAVAGAAGGVGSIAVQLARQAGATVLGIAGPGNDAWLSTHGVIPVNRGDGLGPRLKSAAPAQRIDAFLDFFGQGYVELAVRELGVSPKRVNSIIDFGAVEKFGTQSAGSAAAANVGVLAELAALIADGKLEIPIAATYKLDSVRDAYRDLEQRHTRGKIVLVP